MKNMPSELPVQVQFDQISADQAGQRIDNYLITRLKGAPKTLIYRILRKGEVRVNKGRIKPDYRLQAGDTLRIPPVRLPAPNEPVLVGQGILNALEASVLFEDKGLIIVNKPAGLAVHGGSGLNFEKNTKQKTIVGKIIHFRVLSESRHKFTKSLLTTYFRNSR